VSPAGTAADEVLAALGARGLPVAEVYTKRGRSRVVEEVASGTTVSYHREEGWAVRAGDDRRSLFAAGTGAPDPAGPGGSWPEADGEALELPSPRRSPVGHEGDWRDPADLDAPLMGEREALGLLATLRQELAAELPAARWLRARLADGASEWEVASRVEGGSGVSAAARGRAAFLRVEAALSGDRPVAAGFEVAAREARSFDARALARRIADRLAVAAAGSSPERDRAALLLAPPVGARLLAALLPLLVGPRGAELAGRLADRDGRLGSPALDVVDDGRLPGGVLAAPYDGEGVATGAVRLVAAGVYRQPLLTWRDAGASWPGRPGGSAREARGGERSAGRATGCLRRPGWRDLPQPSPSHLFLAPDPEVGVGRLLGEIARGYYLIDVDGPPVVDWAEGRLSVPVVGFTIERGRPAAPLAGATVEGGVGTLLRGISAVARDLEFFPLAGGMVGAPTMLVTGLEIRG
jgi:predicted Zn-dependent protease